jgi:hypothetical protein
VTARDVTQVRYQLTLGAEAATRLCAHLDDLHSMAFLQAVTDHEHVSGSQYPPPGVETVGDLRARTLWNRLVASAVDLDTLAPLERSIGNYFAVGPSPEPSRGALIRKGEFIDALRAQRRRHAAGEYTPTRIEDQPGYGQSGP